MVIEINVWVGLYRQLLPYILYVHSDNLDQMVLTLESLGVLETK